MTSSNQNDDSGCFSLLFFALLLIVLGLLSCKQAIVDSQNRRTVILESSGVTFRVKPDSQGRVVQLTERQAPPDDFQVIGTLEDDSPFVGEVNNSFARWYKQQRAETYQSLISAIKKSKDCGGKVHLDISGANYNNIFGKNYPVVITAKSICPAK